MNAVEIFERLDDEGMKTITGGDDPNLLVPQYIQQIPQKDGWKNP